MSVFWLIWIACDQPNVSRTPTWTAQESLRPTWELLDVDDDGTVSMDEWWRVSYGSPGFEALDLDGSRGLGLAELLTFVREIDPDGFDGKRMKLKSNAGELAASGPVPREVRHVGNVLVFLAEEIEEDVRVGSLPSNEEIFEASWTRSLSSPESRAVLVQLRVAWSAVGRTFPEELARLLEQPKSQ